MEEPMETDGENVLAAPPEPAAGALVVVPTPDADAGSYTWKVENWSSKSREKKVHSDVFVIGGKKWRLLIFPLGNTEAGTHLSLYLDSSQEEPANLSIYHNTAFTLVLHANDGAQDIKKDTAHKFVPERPDWGFNTFVSLQELRTPALGLLGPDDSLTVSVHARVTHLTNWDTYDSKKATGFVGLKNQGATCYMNSLLQTLFHIPYFRKAVYHMPTTEAESPNASIPLALQSLFYKLQFGDAAASTKDLTQSFGWDTAESFQQHDVQELNRVLCDKLDEKMKGTSVEGTIATLFEGHTSTYIECVDVPFSSSRKESFLDLQLDVKGCRDVAASFKRYVEEERLDGDNQYHAEGHGLQNARKGVRFTAFPPVLQLQLKRFEYDYGRDAMCKVNDRYEFPLELDLNPFLHPPAGGPDAAAAPAAPDARYVLHSVLVHSGGATGGHYYAFVRPGGGQGDWFKFDDERVTRVEASAAVEDNYGDGGWDTDANGGALNSYSAFWKSGRLSNAYMLVYVRAADTPRVVCAVGEADIPEHVRLRLQAEAAEKARKAREKAEAHLYTVVRPATDGDIAARVSGRDGDAAFDLVDWERVKPLRVPKQAPFADLKAAAAEALGVPVAAQRWWLWSKRQNGTLRPCRPLAPSEDAAPISTLGDAKPSLAGGTLLGYGAKRDAAAAAREELKLLLEAPWPPASPVSPADAAAAAPAAPPQPPPPIAKGDLLLFFKLYDPLTETLSYLGRAFVAASVRVAELRQAIQPSLPALASLPATSELLFFEEVKFDPVMVELLADKKSTLKAAQLEDGDILIVQRALSPAEARGVRHALAPSFMSFVKNRLVVTARELPGATQAPYVPVEPPAAGANAPPGAAATPPQPQPGAPLTLELARDSTYDEVAAALAAALRLPDPQLLRLTGPNTLVGGPKLAPYRFREFGRETLTLLLTHFAAPIGDTLYYETLDLPLPQLEALKTLKVEWFNERAESVKTVTLRLPRGASVADALSALRAQLTPADFMDADATSADATSAAAQAPPPPPPLDASTPLRLMEVYSSRIYKIFAPDEIVDHINDSYWKLRAEAVPPDQVGVAPGVAGGGNGMRLVNVCHVRRDMGYVSAFGDPFVMVLRDDEPLASVKARVAAKLGMAYSLPPPPSPEDAALPEADTPPGDATPPAAAAPGPPPPAADFGAWKWGLVSLGRIEFLEADAEPVGPRFAKASRDSALCSTYETYLGMEHEERRGARRAGAGVPARSGLERSVRIYG